MAQPQQEHDRAASNTRPPRPARGEATPAAEEPRSFAGSDGRRQPNGGAEALHPSKSVNPEGAAPPSEDRHWMTKRTAELWRVALEPWLSLQTEAMKLVESSWKQSWRMFESSGAITARPFSSLLVAPMLGQPPADLKETTKGYALDVELPGLTEEDLDIEVRDHVLVISAEKRDERVGAAPWISERRFGRLDRVFTLPANVDRDRISTGVRNGVLNVELPKLATPREAATMAVTNP